MALTNLQATVWQAAEDAHNDGVTLDEAVAMFIRYYLQTAEEADNG